MIHAAAASPAELTATSGDRAGSGPRDARSGGPQAPIAGPAANRATIPAIAMVWVDLMRRRYNGGV